MPEIEFKGRRFDSAVALSLEVIGGTLKIPILWRLKDRPWRYGELKKNLGKVTHRKLTEQLRQLEKDGLVLRTVFPIVPPKVEYSLTPAGLTVMPVIESLDLLRHVYRVSPERYAENLATFRSLLDLDEFLYTPVRSLSLGQRMRADLAGALMHDPRIVFLDEPTIGLDVVAKERIRTFIRRMNAQREVTVILTTHDLGDVERLCPRVLMIDHGKLLYDGAPVGIDRSGPIHTLRYTPQTNFVGEETFTYQVADARGGTGSAIVRVQVGYFTLGPDDFSALSGSLNNELDVRANDLLLPDTNSLRVIAAVGVPDRGGTVVTSAARNRLLYSPRPGLVGIETFPYTMADDSGGITTAVARVRVYPAGSDRHTAPVEMTVVGVNDPLVISDGKRYTHIEGILTRLTGAEAATAVNNNAAAVLLCLNTLAKGKEVGGLARRARGDRRLLPCARGDGAEQRHSCERSDQRTRPISRTTKRPSIPIQASCSRVHTSNYKIVGFTKEVSPSELAELGRKHKVPVMWDLGSGSILALASYGIGDEPTVKQAMHAGVDILTFSGDKLLGGPQAGLIVGRAPLDLRFGAGRTVEYERDGVDYVGGFSDVGIGDVTAGARIPRSAGFVASKDLLKRLGPVVLLLLIGAALFGIVWAHRFTRPLERLSAAAGEISKGKFQTAVSIAPGDEIGDLATAFNQMAGGLRERDEPLQVAQTQLVQSEKMSAFGQLGAGIAHEVKNPLAGILGCAQLSLRKVEKGSPVEKNLDGLSDQMAYEVTKALYENTETLGQVHPKGKEIALKTALQSVSIPLHPGAEKYYREKGLIK